MSNHTKIMNTLMRGEDNTHKDEKQTKACLYRRKMPKDDQKDASVRMQWLICCRFIIAAYIWFRGFSTMSNAAFEQIETFRWHDTTLGIPTAVLIAIWKFLELFDKYKTTRWRALFILSKISFFGAVTILFSTLIIPSCKEFYGFGSSDEEDYAHWYYDENCIEGNKNPIRFPIIYLYYVGLGMIGLANSLEIVSAIVTFRKNGMKLIASLIFQTSALFGLLFRFKFSYAWIGLFFLWEGTILCVINNKKTVLPYWNALFKLLATIAFWTTSGNFDWYFHQKQSYMEDSWPFFELGASMLPLLLFLSSFFFHVQVDAPSVESGIEKIVPSLLSFILPVGFILSIFFKLRLPLQVSYGIVLLWSFRKWLLVLRKPTNNKPTMNDHGNQHDETKESGFWSIMWWRNNKKKKKRYQSVFLIFGEFFNFLTCCLFFIQSILMHWVREKVYEGIEKNNFQEFIEDVRSEFSLSLMFLNIALGVFYFMHSVCWIKVYFRLGESKESASVYVLSEDTYTLMMFSKVFGQTWALCFSVFAMQATLILMIIAAQWEQGFLNSVPYNVSLSTRIGQIAGMILILLYQRDYWVSSTLLEIYVFAGESRHEIKGEKIKTVEGHKNKFDEEVNREGSDSDSVNFSKEVSIMLPSCIRLLQSMGVVAASTVLILQSDNIIDLVKDYTAIFFISEIDDFVFTLAFEGYLGAVLKETTDHAKETCVPDVKEHPFRTFGFMTIFGTMMALWVYVTNNQLNGTLFKENHETCFNKIVWEDIDILKYKNGECDELLNFAECNFDGGDCMPENLVREVYVSNNLANCIVEWKSYIGEFSN